MTFRRKHPYLFLELIGFGILLLDGIFTFIAGLLELFCDPVYMIIVLAAMAAGFIILVSPAIVFLIRKKGDSRKFDNMAIHLCSTSRKYRWQTIFICFFCVFLFVAVAGASAYIGLPFLAFLGVYPAALVYIPWTKYMLKNFYGDKEAEKHCNLINVADADFFDRVDINTALSSFGPQFGTFSFNPGIKPSESYSGKYLNLVYSALRFEGKLRSDILNIYILDIKCVNEKFGISLDEEESYLWCIPISELSDSGDLRRLTREIFCPLPHVIYITLYEQLNREPTEWELGEIDEDELDDE